MGVEKEKDRLVASKLSVAIIAYTGNMADYVDTRVLMVVNRDGKAGPVAGKMEISDNVPENPFEALKREWAEETGNQKFEFQKPVRLHDTIFAQGDGFTDIGFIYRGILTEEAVEIFEDGKKIEGDEDIVEARLFNIDEILAILRNWKNRLTHPEINAQTLINIVNTVMINHDSLFDPGTKYDPFTLEYFGMDFKVTSLNQLSANSSV